MPEVTFQSNSRILGYRPGQIIKAEITPQLRALLERGRHLTLIDPPSLDDLYNKDKNGKSSDKPKTNRKSRKLRDRDGVEAESGASSDSSEAVSSSGGRDEVEKHNSWSTPGFPESWYHNAEGETSTEDL